MAQIRSLSRGLETIALLNRRDSATAGEIARELGIPRATVYRILETLVEQELVRQHDHDQRFRITPNVRTLSAGFTDEDHMAHISARYLARVTRKLKWPVALATVSGVDLIIRENTDNISPLSVEKFSRGYRMSILQSASGLCILAHMPAARRMLTIETLLQVEQRRGQAATDVEALQRTFRLIRRQGYAIHYRHRRYSDLTALAVPILPEHGRVRGAVAIRYARSAIDQSDAVRQFQPEIRAAADKIARRIRLHEENQARRAGRRGKR